MGYSDLSRLDILWDLTKFQFHLKHIQANEGKFLYLFNFQFRRTRRLARNSTNQDSIPNRRGTITNLNSLMEAPHHRPNSHVTLSRNNGRSIVVNQTHNNRHNCDFTKWQFNLMVPKRNKFLNLCNISKSKDVNKLSLVVH